PTRAERTHRLVEPWRCSGGRYCQFSSQSLQAGLSSVKDIQLGGTQSVFRVGFQEEAVQQICRTLIAVFAASTHIAQGLVVLLQRLHGSLYVFLVPFLTLQ